MVRSCADIIHLDEVVPQEIKLLRIRVSPFLYCISICNKLPPIGVPLRNVVLRNRVYNRVDRICAESKTEGMEKGKLALCLYAEKPRRIRFNTFQTISKTFPPIITKIVCIKFVVTSAKGKLKTLHIITKFKVREKK